MENFNSDFVGLSTLTLFGYRVKDQGIYDLLKERIDGFYYVAAYVALNGGIPEFNYEYYAPVDLPGLEDQYLPYIDFIDALGKVRTGWGKDFLVYGRMMPAPETGCGTTVYQFENINYTPGTCRGCDELAGTVEFDNIVSSAYELDGTIALFFCNVSGEAQKAEFELQAGRDYGVFSGKITLQRKDSVSGVGEIKDGKAEISVDLEPQEIVMLTF